MTNHNVKTSRSLTQLKVIAIAAAMTVVPLVANAADATIWGRQKALGDFETDKVTLSQAATISAVTSNGNTNGICIWSGMPTASVVVCGQGSKDLVGRTLPAGPGYFVIPGKRSLNGMSEAFVQVDY